VSPVGTRSSGVVNYAVSLTVDSLPPDLPLRESMTALATITTDRRENVLLVPDRALRTVGGRRVVMVSTGPTTSEAREVTVGLANDQFTEILSGLNDGDAVVISTSGTTTTRTGAVGAPGGGAMMVR
jgi:multidrug efflux pump subunit AcrA (membrane-fusion protein)